MIGGIETGGTKCVLAVGESPDSIAATHTIPTSSPDETVAEALAWFAAQPSLTALGLATFGPVGLDRNRADYGHILATPKPGWSGFDFAGALADGLRVPVAVETDVNAAALAEARADGSVGSLAYMTVGTGIGVGLVIDGHCVHGAAHPEMGHYYPRRARTRRALPRAGMPHAVRDDIGRKGGFGWRRSANARPSRTDR